MGWRESLRIPGERTPARRFKGLDLPAPDAAPGEVRIRTRAVQERVPVYEETPLRPGNGGPRSARTPSGSASLANPIWPRPAVSRRPAVRDRRREAAARGRAVYGDPLLAAPIRSSALFVRTRRSPAQQCSEGPNSRASSGGPAVLHAHLDDVEVLAPFPARMVEADGAVGSG
ncbi:hypothetical protein DL768_003662 [Monosporascus sp. mg162]|nr:hypothetical protein DL768_003662 [Monosporascus sp. mg162]